MVRDNIFAAEKHLAGQIYDILLSPNLDVSRPGDRQRAQMAALALLAMTLIGGIWTVIAAEKMPMAFFTVVTAVGYILSRTPLHRLAAALAVAAISLPPYFTVWFSNELLGPGQLLGRFAWLAAAIVLSSLILEPRQTVLIAAGNQAAILALSLMRTDIHLLDLGPSLAFVATLTTLTLEVMRQRSRIENERRKEAIQRERQLNEMSRLISGTLDLSRVLDSALRIATELVESDGGLLELLSEDERTIVEIHSNNMPKSLENALVPAQQGVAWSIAQTGRSVRLDRYADHPNAVEGGISYGIQGFIGAPVIAGEKVLGALAVFSLMPDKKFEDRDLQLLEAVARQTGVAIQNARLFSALNQRDAILEVVALEARQFLQSADLPGSFHALLARLGRQTGSSHAYIFETHLGPGGQRLISQTYHWTDIEHASPLDNPEFQNTVLDNRGLERWLDAMESGEPFYSVRSQMSLPERAVLSPLGAKAILAMPIYVRAESEGGATGKLQWWGLIGFDDYRNERSWSEAEVDALKIVAGLLGAAIQRQRSDQALQDRETLYRRAISAAGAVPYYQDHTLEKYVFIGEGIEALTGYRAAEITPPFWRSLGQSLVMRGEAAGLSPAEAEQQSLSGELRVWNSDNLIRTRDGQTRWVADTAIQIVGADGQSHGWVGILQDITERVQAEAEVRELNAALETRVRERTAELEAANKELEAFAYSVSHDLRAPLRAIDGYSRMLSADYADRLDDDGRTFIDNVRQSAQNMAHLIEDLLQLSRVTRAELKRSRVDLSALGQAILNEYARQEPYRAANVHVQPSMAAYGDPNLLRVVMENLLGNAWKFTSHTVAPHIEAGCTRANGATVYYVRDNGAGFDMRYVDKLFQPFQRLHAPSEFEGTGVGLATVQRIIRRHGGRIWAEGTIDKGATFYFTLGE